MDFVCDFVWISEVSCWMILPDFRNLSYSENHTLSVGIFLNLSVVFRGEIMMLSMFLCF